MTNRIVAKTNLAAFWAILTLSAFTMIWLVWRFPLVTGLITLGLMLGFGFSARTARSLDADMTDLDHSEQSAG